MNIIPQWMTLLPALICAPVTAQATTNSWVTIPAGPAGYTLIQTKQCPSGIAWMKPPGTPAR